jgi:hypothetical protein
MALQKQARDIMNTDIRNSGLPEMPLGMRRVFDSETGVMHDAASVKDRAAYHRYLMMVARTAGGKKADHPADAPAPNPGQ